jgi:hypothetical protein
VGEIFVEKMGKIVKNNNYEWANVIKLFLGFGVVS